MLKWGEGRLGHKEEKDGGTGLHLCSGSSEEASGRLGKPGGVHGLQAVGRS